MGGTITAIEVQQRRKNRVNVYLDDAYAFSVSTIVAERAGLAVGTFLSNDDMQALAADDAYQRAFDSALNFLSYRPRSVREVRLNLARKGVDPASVDKVVTRLIELGLLDDRAFAQFWQENRQRCSPRGPRAIKAELVSKGLERDVIDGVLEDNLDQERDAYAAAQKKIPSLRGLDYRAFRQRLGSHLLRRGFSYDVIATLIRRLWRETHPELAEEEYD